jgi:glycosyltransferase involved in cell wall biosynthesis
MRFWGWRLGFRDPVLINYVPVLAEAMKGRRRRPVIRNSLKVIGNTNNREPVTNNSPRVPRVVYHCVDRWDAFAMYDSSLMGEMDRRCCQYADLVIASAGELYDRCRAINPNTVLIPHGVDWEHFREKVNGDELSVIRNSNNQQPLTNNSDVATIGFFGLLSEWVDQELILRLAKEFSSHDTPHLNPLPHGERKDGNQLHPLHLHPLPSRERAGVRGGADVPLRERAGVWGGADVPLRERAGVRGSSLHARILLIGKADVDVSRLQGIPNIELSGPIPFAELPAHVATFTVGIIPFVVNDLTRSVNPIKLREMLSAGCPVVSTNLPEVARYAGSAQIAHNHDEFVTMVRRALENPLPPQDRLALSDSMAGETWTAKVQEILALLHESHS